VKYYCLNVGETEEPSFMLDSQSHPVAIMWQIRPRGSTASECNRIAELFKVQKWTYSSKLWPKGRAALFTFLLLISQRMTALPPKMSMLPPLHRHFAKTWSMVTASMSAKLRSPSFVLDNQSPTVAIMWQIMSPMRTWSPKEGQHCKWVPEDCWAVQAGEVIYASAFSLCGNMPTDLNGSCYWDWF
jgi:hypothetical protein